MGEKPQFSEFSTIFLDSLSQPCSNTSKIYHSCVCSSGYCHTHCQILKSLWYVDYIFLEKSLSPPISLVCAFIISLENTMRKDLVESKYKIIIWSPSKGRICFVFLLRIFLSRMFRKSCEFNIYRFMCKNDLI